MHTPYSFFTQLHNAIGATLMLLLCLAAPPASAAKVIPRTAMSEMRQIQAQKVADEWKDQGIFSTPVRVNIKPINPNSEAASTQHETFFENGICNITVYVDPMHGSPPLPGLPTLTTDEYTMAFEMIVFHELSHCAHFARGLRYDNPRWDAKYNNAMSVQMVMAQQMYNETRFVDAQMEHVADAHAAIRMRQRYKDSPQVNTLLEKFFALRIFWQGIAVLRSGATVYIPHATQMALRWGMTVDLKKDHTALQWLNQAVHEASITALANAKTQVAWGGLGALLCATAASKQEWSSTASTALARIAANDITFMPPGPWRVLPLDFNGAADKMDSNRDVFVKTVAVHALQDLDDLRDFMTSRGTSPIPLEYDKIGRPEGVIPMDLAMGSPTAHSTTDVRQGNGCVAINPKD